jgi:hypothetical protein
MEDVHQADSATEEPSRDRLGHRPSLATPCARGIHTTPPTDVNGARTQPQSRRLPWDSGRFDGPRTCAAYTLAPEAEGLEGAILTERIRGIAPVFLGTIGFGRFSDASPTGNRSRP